MTMTRVLITALFLLFTSGFAKAVTLEDYLPDGVSYDPDIPTPASVLGYEVGEWHVRPDLLVAYMHAIAASSDRVTIEVSGYTHERRPQVLLTITDPANQARINAIREAHVAATDGNDFNDNGPVVVWLGYSIHGNEPSGSNSALVVAYHLAAAQDEQTRNLLSDTVVLLDPSFNPDGLGRFAQWANSHKSTGALVSDPENREHNEVWPYGRTNHYWFDLNRDWLLLTHPESRNRVAQFQRWRPNVLTDHHEMGSNATFFFQPGVPERKNPLTPDRNEELTGEIAQFHARALDAVGQPYYSGEGFDDYYYGKGSTYPDVQGSIGILFEQASSRGHLMDTINGDLAFPHTIRNQFLTSLSTLRAAHEMRDELRRYQHEFYAESRRMADQDSASAIVFGDGGDPQRAWEMADRIRQHDIDVYELAEDLRAGGRNYRAGAAYVVPLGQRQYRLIRAIFETRKEFEDSTFYDVSTWTFPLAFDVPWNDVRGRLDRDLLGEAVGAPPVRRFNAKENVVAYAFDWSSYAAPAALRRLLDAEVKIRANVKPMTAQTTDGEHAFDRGTVLVPLGINPEKREAIEEALGEAADDGIRVHALTTGLTGSGVDLGSPSVLPLEEVKPAILVGPGISSYEVGEVWHLLDTRVAQPLSMIDTHRFMSLDLNDYTHLLLVHGSYRDLDDAAVEKIRGWVTSGGVLVATKNSAKWVTDKHLNKASKPEEEGAKKDAKDEDGDEETEKEYRSYAQFEDDFSQKVIGGAIVGATVDTTHPIGYGVGDEEMALFKNGTVFLEPSENAYVNVVRYREDPVLSGFVSEDLSEKLDGKAAVIAERVGGGLVVRFAENPNFRGYWYGSNKLYLNALYFSQLVYNTTLPKVD